MKIIIILYTIAKEFSSALFQYRQYLLLHWVDKLTTRSSMKVIKGKVVTRGSPKDVSAFYEPISIWD